MIIKVLFQNPQGKKVEVYTIKKEKYYISGFIYGHNLKDKERYKNWKCFPHWTYHSKPRGKPYLHTKGYNGKAWPRDYDIQEFKKIDIHPLTGFQGKPDIYFRTINVEEYPEEADKSITFPVKEDISYGIQPILFNNKNELQKHLTGYKANSIILKKYSIHDENAPEIIILITQINPNAFR